jgi:translation initiation factor 3 subunit F
MEEQRRRSVFPLSLHAHAFSSPDAAGHPSIHPSSLSPLCPSSFPLPQVAIDIPHHANLLALHAKVSPKETVVGWFSAGPPGPSPGDALIHDFYRRAAAGAPGASTAPPAPGPAGGPPPPPTPSPSALPPVFVTIDAALACPAGRPPLSAYVGRALTLKGASLATEFVEAPCEVVAAEVDRAPVGALLRGGGGGDDAASTSPDASAATTAPGEAAALDATVDRLVGLLGAGAAYARRCADGSEPRPSPAAGRALSDALAALPALPPAELAALAADASQDALLVAYLAQLVRAQVALADRLGTAALPIL